MQKTILVLLIIVLSIDLAKASNITNLSASLAEISNFHSVSEELASSGLIDLEDYQLINQYGFKHVINLIPGEQSEEREKVNSFGMTYEQIQVDWAEPTLDNFEKFVALMNRYGKDKVYVHCEANYRASTFVYLYRIINLNISQEKAKKDLNKIWKPSKTWQEFIDKIKFGYQKP